MNITNAVLNRDVIIPKPRIEKGEYNSKTRSLHDSGRDEVWIASEIEETTPKKDGINGYK